MLSCTLSGELSTDTVTASVLLVDPVDAEDREVDGDGEGVVTGEAVSDEVERVERLFTGVVSDVICWFSEDKLVGVGPVASVGHSSPASAWYDPSLKQYTSSGAPSLLYEQPYSSHEESSSRNR